MIPFFFSTSQEDRKNSGLNSDTVARLDQPEDNVPSFCHILEVNTLKNNPGMGYFLYMLY